MPRSACRFLAQGTRPTQRHSPTQSGAQENVGLYTEFVPANFIDVLKTGYHLFSGVATPGSAALDSNGYPTQSFTGSISLIIDQAQWTGTPYILSWTSGTTLQISNSAASSCSLAGTGGSITGCSGGGVTLTINGSGAGSLTFTPGSVLTMTFPGTGTYGAAGTASLTLMRSSDVSTYAAYVAASDPGAITSEFLTVLKNAHMKSMRTMSWDQTNNSNQTKWAYRTVPAALSWNYHYPLGAWSGGSGSAGAITGTNAYSAAAKAPDQSSGAWTQGEVIMGNVANSQSAPMFISNITNNGFGACRIYVTSTASLTNGQQVFIGNTTDTSGEPFACNGVYSISIINSTSFDLSSSTFSGTFNNSGAGVVGLQTLTVAGKTGTKFIASLQGFPPGANYDGFSSGIAAGFNTFVYDSILDKLLYSPGGITTSVPIEVSASIANQINANLWANIPAMVDDNFVTQWATAALALKSTLYLMPEYGNEDWNFGFNSTVWSAQRGYAFGFPNNSYQAIFGWYGLRTRQVMGNLIPAVWSSRMSNLRRIMAVQAFSDPSINVTYRLNGTDLAPSGTSTGIGNAAYSAYTGSANYTAFPNRPIDVVETLAYAPYTSGVNLSDQQLNGGTNATSDNAGFLQTLATAFAANPSDPTALAMLDNDQRQGTTYARTQSVTCPSGTTFTLNGHGFTGFFESILFTSSGGTVCNGLTTGVAYCVISITTNTFQVASYNNQGNCNSTPISVTPGTGTTTVGPVPQGNSLSILQAIIYPRWEYVASLYDSQRPSGASALRAEWYEGASEPRVPSASALGSLGVTIGGTGAGAESALINGLNAWKNSTSGYNFLLSYYNQFEGLSHSKTPSNLVLIGAYSSSNPYGLVNGNLPNSSVYQTYNGFAAFVGVP
jgi:hypothetical protein